MKFSMHPRILPCLLAVSVSVSVPTTAQEQCNYTDVNAVIREGLQSYFHPWCDTEKNTDGPWYSDEAWSSTGSYRLDCDSPSDLGIGYGLLDTSGNRISSVTNVPKKVVYEAIATDPMSDAKPTSFEIDGNRISSFEDPCNAYNEVAGLMTDVLWGNATCDPANVTNEIVAYMNGVWGPSSCTFQRDRPLPVYECKRKGNDLIEWSSGRYEALGWYHVRNEENFWSENTIWDRAFRVGCLHPDPCNALKRVKEATNRVLDPEYYISSSDQGDSACEICSDYCNASCSYYCGGSDSSSAIAFSPRSCSSWGTMPTILAAIALVALL